MDNMYKYLKPEVNEVQFQLKTLSDIEESFSHQHYPLELRAEDTQKMGMNLTIDHDDLLVLLQH